MIMGKDAWEAVYPKEVYWCWVQDLDHHFISNRNPGNLCALERASDASLGLGPLASVKVKQSTAFKNILDNCVASTLWQRFAKGPHIGVMIRWPQLFKQ